MTYDELRREIYAKYGKDRVRIFRRTNYSWRADPAILPMVSADIRLMIPHTCDCGCDKPTLKWRLACLCRKDDWPIPAEFDPTPVPDPATAAA